MPTPPPLDPVAVVGAGAMGRQIAVLVALRGGHARCTDSDPAALADAAAFAESYLAGRVAKGRIGADEAAAALRRLAFPAELEASVDGAALVVEAIGEDLEAKRRLFAVLAGLVDESCLLATNSSTFPSSRLADVTSHPERVLNLHFFNPALVMRLVEVVQGPHTADACAEAALALCRHLGKVPVHLRREVPGFVLNRLLRALQREAFWLLEMGVASVEEIDTALVEGAGHPMGVFRLMDLTGLDLSHDTAIAAFQESGDRSLLPPPSLVAKVARGELGRKTGRGWYDDYGEDPS